MLLRIKRCVLIWLWSTRNTNKLYNFPGLVYIRLFFRQFSLEFSNKTTSSFHRKCYIQKMQTLHSIKNFPWTKKKRRQKCAWENNISEDISCNVQVSSKHISFLKTYFPNNISFLIWKYKSLGSIKCKLLRIHEYSHLFAFYQRQFFFLQRHVSFHFFLIQKF